MSSRTPTPSLRAIRRWVFLLGPVCVWPAGAADGVAFKVEEIAAPIEDGGTVCSWNYEGEKSIVELSGRFLFGASEANMGCELFQTDSDPDHTSYVKDLVLGHESSQPRMLGVAGGIAYFSASDPLLGTELWRTDGTPEGTDLVRDIREGPENSHPSPILDLGGWAVFTARDELHGREIWRSDGTAAGTTLVADLVPGPESSIADQRLVPLGDAAYFLWVDRLWRVNADASSVESVVTFSPNGTLPTSLVDSGGRLYFLMTTMSWQEAELWRSDGTAPGTARVRALGWSQSGYGAIYPSGDGRLFVTTLDAIWHSDGTEAGTHLVSFAGGATPQIWWPRRGAAGKLYFSGYDPVHGYEPWVSDGTTAGSFLLGDLSPGHDGSMTFAGDLDFLSVGSSAVFVAESPSLGAELWTTDGTTAGTRPLVDFHPGPDGSRPSVVGTAGGDVWVAASVPGIGEELYRTDGVQVPVRASSLGGPTTFVSMSDLTDVGGTLFFELDASQVPEVWKSDGTSAGTFGLRGELGLYDNVHDFVEIAGGEALAIGSSDGDVAADLMFRTEGSSIVEVRHFEYGCFVNVCGLPDPPRRAGEVAVLSWRLPSQGWELWTSDGTTSGTGPMLDLQPGPEGSKPRALVDYLGEVAFVADDGVNGSEPWVTSGTPESTRLLADVEPGPGGSGIWKLIPSDDLSGSFYFLYDGNHLGYWNAAEKQTVALAPDVPGFDGLGVAAGRLYFDTELGAGWQRDELWTSDGTPGGTVLLRDIWPGEQGSTIRDPAILGGRLYFRACEPSAGCELWRSDGTAAGTQLFIDLVPGPDSSFPASLETIDARIHFLACRPADGCEPWITDGSVAGTHRVADLAAGPASSVRGSSYPGDDWATVFEGSGSLVYFAADDGSGNDLWALPRALFYDGFESGDTERW